MMSDKEYETFLETAEEAYPMGIGTAEDVADLICFLITKGSWMTGGNYVIDGGRSINC